MLIEGLGAAGWDVPAPAASMFAWAPIPQGIRRAGLARLLQAAAGPGQGRGLAGHRLRRAWRRACPHRAGREQAPHPPGHPQHPPGDGRSRPRHRPLPARRRRQHHAIEGSRLSETCRIRRPMKAPLRIGIAGLGTVGAGVVKLLAEQGRLLSLRGGRPLKRRRRQRARARPRSVASTSPRVRWDERSGGARRPRPTSTSSSS